MTRTQGSKAISAPGIDTLWLDALQRLSGRVAHEIKGALNGVSVNVEVVRSRAERAGVAASAVATFATAAADQLDALIIMTEAMLALARAGPDTTDVATVAKQLASLLSPGMRSVGRTFELDINSDLEDAERLTGAPLSGVRLALCAVLLAATELPGDGLHLICRHKSGGPPQVDIWPVPVDAAFPHEAAQALASVCIEVRADGHGISIVFPAYPGTSDEEV